MWQPEIPAQSLCSMRSSSTVPSVPCTYSSLNKKQCFSQEISKIFSHESSGRENVSNMHQHDLVTRRLLCGELDGHALQDHALPTSTILGAFSTAVCMLLDADDADFRVPALIRPAP